MDDYNRKLLDISTFALDSLLRGCNKRQEGDIETALKYYAIAWAFNRMQEYQEGIYMCNRLINGYVNDKEELDELYEYGSYSANKLLYVVDSVNEFFGR